jgi:hypothetical protein
MMSAHFTQTLRDEAYYSPSIGHGALIMWSTRRCNKAFEVLRALFSSYEMKETLQLRLTRMLRSPCPLTCGREEITESVWFAERRSKLARIEEKYCLNAQIVSSNHCQMISLWEPSRSY